MSYVAPSTLGGTDVQQIKARLSEDLAAIANLTVGELTAFPHLMEADKKNQLLNIKDNAINERTDLLAEDDSFDILTADTVDLNKIAETGLDCNSKSC